MKLISLIIVGGILPWFFAAKPVQAVECKVAPDPQIVCYNDKCSVSVCLSYLDNVDPSYYSSGSPCHYIYQQAVAKKENCEIKYVSQNSQPPQVIVIQQPAATLSPTLIPVVDTPTPKIQNSKPKNLVLPTITPSSTSSPQSDGIEPKTENKSQAEIVVKKINSFLLSVIGWFRKFTSFAK